MTAILTGVAVALLSWTWRFDWLPPELWEDVAVAAGLRPPEGPFPLLWHLLVSQLFRWAGPANAIQTILVGGHVALGVCSMLAVFILRDTMPSVMRKAEFMSGGSRWIVRLALLQGVILFTCAEPVWTLGQAFGPTMLHLLILLLAICIFTGVAWHGWGFPSLYWTMLLLGVLSAETPLGIILCIATLIVVRIAAETNPDVLENPLADPFARVVVMRRMTASAFAGWLATATVNISFFCVSGGLDAHEWNGFLVTLNYFYQYAKVLGAVAAPSGWLLMVIVVLVPLVLSIVHVNAATDDDRFLSYWHGMFFAMTGLVAFFQLAGWRSFWFWTWTNGAEPVNSPLVLCICAALCVQTALYAISVLVIEIFFRNYRRIAGVRYQDSVEDTVLGPRLAASFRVLGRWGRMAVRFAPLILLALLLPYRVKSADRAVVRALHDCAWQTALECLDAKYLFTDGAMDPAVELCALMQGRAVRAISLTGGDTSRDKYIRARMAADNEDRDMMRYSGADALRTWIRHKQVRMKDVAMQLGFELWGRGRQKLPPCAGLVARSAGFPEGFAEEGVRKAHELAARVMALLDDSKQLENVDPALREVFSFMQWRIARMCRVRADSWDRLHKIDEALAESKRADDLDSHNVAFARVRRQLEMVGQGGMRLTPREGMKVGMDRADFRMAEVFAQQVLLSDPGDAGANFVIGMNYLGKEQYGRAIVHLTKCLSQRPDDPAILNNLAVAQMRQGNLEDAESNVRRALAVRKDLPEAKRTLESILRLKAEEDERRKAKGE